MKAVLQGMKSDDLAVNDVSSPTVVAGGVPVRTTRSLADEVIDVGADAS